MRFLHRVAFLAIALPAIFIPPAAASPARTTINFSSLDSNHPYKVSGVLYLPENAASPVPAIVLIHGTLGIDKRSLLYRKPLLDAGIGIFEVDFKTGVYKSTTDRPDPDIFLPLAFAALKELRKIPSIDPSRIGIMGFSLGGQIALRAALEGNRKQWMGADKGFVAFATFYPVCKAFIKELDKNGSQLTGGPIIVFYGTNDSYGEGSAVPKLKKLLAKKFNFQLDTVEYLGASHAFNLHVPDMSYFDPAANGFRGHTSWNPEATNDSILKVVAFLKENLVSRV
jgi:dienelactone hydrolase